MPPKHPLKFRSVFISDVHLGYRGARIEYLHSFLKQIDTEYLYLVGDIIDLWSMKKTFYWPQEHNNLLRLILSKAKRGTKIIYIPGNHDEMFRDFVDYRFGKLQVKRNATHITADGRKILVMHGDEFDGVIKCARWLSLLGHHGYELILGLNRRVNWLRRKLDLPYWSLAAYLKHKTSAAVTHINKFEQAVVRAGKQRGMDGVLCGHIHRAKIEHIDGIQYMNCGDWVESCTTITEDFYGHLSLLHWSDRQEVLSQSNRTGAINETELGSALQPDHAA
ncbi:MAG: UDP-2,3-diacylglucosamine diphosphatase [Steroidobacteraceae bacterium]